MKKYFLFFVLFAIGTLHASFAAQVDTLNVYSPSMDKEVPVVVITPESYNNETQFPVFYLLHGYGGNYSNWTQRSDDAKMMADQYNFIIVCPDGGYSSWYFDSPIDSAMRYETFVSKELIDWTDNHFNTIPQREARAISGLSMGGHGALYLAFRHQDVYGACGSMSGGVDIRPFPNRWEIKKQLGEQKTHPNNWRKHTILGMLHLLTPDALEITIDCGTNDFFYDVNLRLHQQLSYRNIPHTFISRPGKHNWDFWKTSIKYHSLFFSDYFNKSLQQ